MMNKWITGLALLGLVACKSQPAYEIRGEFAGAPEGTTVYLGEIDSAKTVNGQFVFKGHADVPLLTDLRVKSINEYGMPSYNGTLIWLENAVMNVVCPWEVLPDINVYTDQMSVSGSALNDMYRDYRRQLAAIGSRDSLWKIYMEVYLLPSFQGGKADVERGMQLMREMQALAMRKRQLAEDFVMKHPTSPIAPELLADLLYGQDYTVAEAEKMISVLDSSLKMSPGYGKLAAAFESFASTAKGQKYMDVTLRDKEGKEVMLSDYIQPGKYNMLEFWASWCAPCRAEIPHLRHVNQAVGKDFNIISISIDAKDADWQKAMKEEGMDWTQLNEMKGFNGESVRKYGITGVPYSLVLDGEGRIIAGNVRGAELDIILTDIFGEKALW